MPHHPAHESAGPPVTASPQKSAVRLQPGQKIVFYGDSSVADQPGFIGVLDTVLNNGPRKLGLTLVNAGIPAASAADLERDLPAILSQHPDWIFILVGGDELQSAAASGNNTSEGFGESLDRLIAAILAAGSRAVLMTITPVIEELDDSAARMLKGYNTAIKTVAERRLVPLVDLQRAFHDLYDRAATYKQQVTLTTDGYHPDPKGHALIARAIILQLGLLAG